MRPALLAALAGAAVLLAGCASPAPAPPASPGPPGGAKVVEVKALGGGDNNVFDPVEVAVPAGGKVRWSDVSGHHTVSFQAGLEPGAPKPDSGDLGPGDTFELAFPRPGTYAYRCLYHSSGFERGKGMVGVVTVT